MRFIKKMKDAADSKNLENTEAVDASTKNELAKEALNELSNLGFGNIVTTFGNKTDVASPTRYFDGLRMMGMALNKAQSGKPGPGSQGTAGKSAGLYSSLAPATRRNKINPVLGYKPQFDPTKGEEGDGRRFTRVIVEGPYAEKQWPPEMRIFIIKSSTSEKELLTFFRADVTKHAKGLDHLKWTELNNSGNADAAEVQVNDTITLKEMALEVVRSELRGQLRQPGTPLEKASDKEYYKIKLKLSAERSKIEAAEKSMHDLHRRYPDERMPDGTPVNDGVFNRQAAAAEFIKCLEDKYGAAFVSRFKEGAGAEETKSPMKLLLLISSNVERAYESSNPGAAGGGANDR